MTTVYNINCDNNNDADTEMNIDWFYFSERTDLNFDDIEDSVRILKQKGIARINTTDAIFQSKFLSNDKGDVYIEGPDSIQPFIESKWVLKHHDQRWTGYDVVFLYRFHSRLGIWENWRNIYTIEPRMTVEPFYDSLEFKVICKDHWVDFADTLSKLIYIESPHSKSRLKFKFMEPIPNPVSSQFSIEFTLYNDSHISLEFYDILGNLIENVANGNFTIGNYQFDIKTDALVQGIYFIILKTDYGSETKKVIKIERNWN